MRSRAAIPASSRSRNSARAGRTARRPVGTAARQTESLEKALSSVGAGKYKLARTTAYVAPGTSHGTQGTRILYDTNKYRLISNCGEKTGKKNYNSSCSMDLPVMSGDSKAKPRSAAYAEFEDRKTGKNFFVVSVHLDDRHSGSLSKEKSLDTLRAAQVRAVYTKVSGLAGSKPILFGGDINSWKTKAGSHAPFNFMTSQGFQDSTVGRDPGGRQVPDGQPLQDDPQGERSGPPGCSRCRHGQGRQGLQHLRERHEGHRLEPAFRSQHGGRRPGPVGLTPPSQHRACRKGLSPLRRARLFVEVIEQARSPTTLATRVGQRAPDSRQHTTSTLRSDVRQRLNH